MSIRNSRVAWLWLFLLEKWSLKKGYGLTQSLLNLSLVTCIWKFTTPIILNGTSSKNAPPKRKLDLLWIHILYSTFTYPDVGIHTAGFWKVWRKKKPRWFESQVFQAWILHTYTYVFAILSLFNKVPNWKLNSIPLNRRVSKVSVHVGH